MKKLLKGFLFLSLLSISFSAEEKYDIIIDKSNFKLYFYDKEQVKEFKVGIGKKGYETRCGEFVVIDKARDPSWSPYNAKWLDKETKEYIEKYGSLPSSHPKNPLNKYYIKISIEGVKEYGIHDYDGDAGIGKKASHGCIRMRTKDIGSIFDKVKIGMRGLIRE